MIDTLRILGKNWLRNIAMLTLMLITLIGGSTAVSAQEVRGWGKNGDGNIGDGTHVDRFAPTGMLALDGNGYLTHVTAVAAGADFSVALKSNGRVVGSGGNFFGQLSDGTELTRFFPVPVLDPSDPTGELTGIIALAAGTYHVLALKSDHTVVAWGYNETGQLGDGTTTIRRSPVQVLDPSDPTGKLTGVIALAGGGLHSLALKSNGTIVAWGLNGSGQLGDNHLSGFQSVVPVPVHGWNDVGNLTDVIAIGAGRTHSLALKSDHTVFAWGNNTVGQCSSMANVLQYTPVPVPNPQMTGNLTDISAISAGYFHNMALKSDGSVCAWGINEYGQLGDNTNSNRSTPVQVLGSGGTGSLSGILAVTAGNYNSFALKSDHTVVAWGINDRGRLGIGSSDFDDHFTPVVVGGLTNVLAIVSGEAHSLVLLPPEPSLSGVITLQGESNPAQSVTFQFRPTANPNSVLNRTLTLNTNGSFTLDDIPAGSYLVAIKGAKWLQKVVAVDNSSGAVTGITVTLSGGDVNNDNSVDITDLLALIGHYNQVSPNAGYLEAADFNSDGANDITDLLLLIGNFNRGGDS